MRISIRIHRDQPKLPVRYDTHELSWWCEDVDAETHQMLSRGIQDSAWFKHARFEPCSTGRPAVPHGSGFLSLRAKFTEEHEIGEIESEISALLRRLGVKHRQHMPLKCNRCARAIGGFGLPAACVYYGAGIKQEDTARDSLDAGFNLPHLDELIRHGEFTITEIQPAGCVAVASDGQSTLAMLRRRTGESLFQLLARLDQAVAKAKNEGVFTDEINRPRPNPRTSFIVGGREEALEDEALEDEALG